MIGICAGSFGSQLRAKRQSSTITFCALNIPHDKAGICVCLMRSVRNAYDIRRSAGQSPDQPTDQGLAGRMAGKLVGITGRMLTGGRPIKAIGKQAIMGLCVIPG